MSKRRSVGNLVIKRENAGFVGERLKVRLLDIDHDYPPYEDWCFYNCGDPDCKEWANCEIVDENGKGTGNYVYHVSECQMEDTGQ